MYIASPPILTKHTQRKTQTEEVCFRRVVTGFSLAPSGRHVLVDLAGGAYIQRYFHVVHCVYVCVCPIVLLLCTYRSINQPTDPPSHIPILNHRPHPPLGPPRRPRHRPTPRPAPAPLHAGLCRRVVWWRWGRRGAVAGGEWERGREGPGVARAAGGGPCGGAAVRGVDKCLALFVCQSFPSLI